MYHIILVVFSPLLELCLFFKGLQCHSGQKGWYSTSIQNNLYTLLTYINKSLFNVILSVPGLGDKTKQPAFKCTVRLMVRAVATPLFIASSFEGSNSHGVTLCVIHKLLCTLSGCSLHSCYVNVCMSVMSFVTRRVVY